MNKTEFIQFLQQPAYIDKAEPGSIEDMVREFPYFQSAHLILARCLHSHDSIYFHRQLKQAAARVTDRSVLYWLINNTFEDKISEPAIEPVSEIKVSDTVTEQLAQETEQTAPPVEEHHDVITSPPETEIKIAADQPAGTGDAEITVTEQHQPDNEISVTENVEKNNDVIIALEDKAVETPVNEKKFLIEKFIREEPRISAPKKDFFSPLNIAQHSDTDNLNIVSETLAQIYAQQGKTAHAIKIYNQLCLIFPEKSSYFAAQIDKLNDSIQP